MSAARAAIGVLIVDDHQLVRDGIRACLDGADGLETVGEAGSASEAIRLAAERSPDVVLLDISMPGGSGLDAVPRLARDAAVLVLSVHDEREYAVAAAKAGAAGYMRKDCAPAALIEAIRRLAGGAQAFSGEALEQVMASHVAERVGAVSASPLTARQREVLVLVARGHSNRDIAAALGIGVRTVETHRAALMDRLQIKTVAGLTRYAVEHGYLSPDA